MLNMSEIDRFPLETREALQDLQTMTYEDLTDYFDRLASDHIESGTYATAADYIEAADRIRRLEVAYDRYKRKYRDEKNRRLKD